MKTKNKPTTKNGTNGKPTGRKPKNPNQLSGSEVIGRTVRPELGQGDDCLRLSRLVTNKDGQAVVSSQQVRVMLALAWVKKSPHTDKTGRPSITRADLKELVGIGRDGLYSQSWLVDLWEAEKAGFIRIEESAGEGRTYHLHSLTASGAKLVDRLIAAGKAK